MNIIYSNELKNIIRSGSIKFEIDSFMLFDIPDNSEDDFSSEGIQYRTMVDLHNRYALELANPGDPNELKASMGVYYPIFPITYIPSLEVDIDGNSLGTHIIKINSNLQNDNELRHNSKIDYIVILGKSEHSAPYELYRYFPIAYIHFDNPPTITKDFNITIPFQINIVQDQTDTSNINLNSDYIRLLNNSYTLGGNTHYIPKSVLSTHTPVIECDECSGIGYTINNQTACSKCKGRKVLSIHDEYLDNLGENHGINIFNYGFYIGEKTYRSRPNYYNTKSTIEINTDIHSKVVSPFLSLIELDNTDETLNPKSFSFSYTPYTKNPKFVPEQKYTIQYIQPFEHTFKIQEDIPTKGLNVNILNKNEPNTPHTDKYSYKLFNTYTEAKDENYIFNNSTHILDLKTNKYNKARNANKTNFINSNENDTPYSNNISLYNSNINCVENNENTALYNTTNSDLKDNKNILIINSDGNMAHYKENVNIINSKQSKIFANNKTIINGNNIHTDDKDNVTLYLGDFNTINNNDTKKEYFVVANGTDDQNRNNAFSVEENYSVPIYDNQLHYIGPSFTINENVIFTNYAIFFKRKYKNYFDYVEYKEIENAIDNNYKMINIVSTVTIKASYIINHPGILKFTDDYLWYHINNILGNLTSDLSGSITSSNIKTIYIINDTNESIYLGYNPYHLFQIKKYSVRKITPRLINGMPLPTNNNVKLY